VFPKVPLVEWREWRNAVSHETSRCMGVEAQHEDDEQMVGVPKGLEALLADHFVRSCIHEQHTQQHDMTSDATCLSVVDIQCRLRADLRFFYVKEVDVVRSDMNDSEQEHGICCLSMQPLTFVQRQESNFWSDYSQNSSAHRKQDEPSIKSQYQSRTSRQPHGKLEPVQSSKLLICFLTPPSVRKQTPVYSPPPNPKQQLPPSEFSSPE